MRAQIEKIVGQHAADVQEEDIEHIAGQLRAGGTAANQRMIH
jgi:hypothetical protein